MRILVSLLLATTILIGSLSAQTIAPITVNDVTVVVEGSTGLERDKALDLAARKAMLQALQQMNPPVIGERANTFIRSQGDLTRYVKTVKIVREVLVPSYTLTANLSFDTAKLYANLGGRMPTSSSTTTSSVSSTVTTQTSTSVATTTPANVPDTRLRSTQTVELVTSSPTEQFKMLGLLSQLPNTTVRISALSTHSAVYMLETPLSLDDIEQALATRNVSTIPGSADGASLRVSF